MNILLTGHNGFIGGNLKKAIEHRLGDNIICLDEEIFYNKNWADELLIRLNNYFPHVIFHVGACSDTLNQDVEYMMTRNYESSIILSNWAKRNNVPLIYSSSAANYGDKSGVRNLYSWSKYTAEQHIISNNQVALRYFNVYGPGEDNKGKMASVARQMFVRHKNDVAVKIFPGQPKRDFVYIDDVVNANLFAFRYYHDIKGDWYDVGSGEANTFESVLEHLEIPFTYTKESEIPCNYQMYTQAIEENMMPNWKPTYTLQKGLSIYKEHLCRTI